MVPAVEMSPEANGAVMPEKLPRRSGGESELAAQADLIRELLAEFQAGNQEIGLVRNDLEGIRKDLGGCRDDIRELTKALRGGNGSEGLMTAALRLQDRVTRVEQRAEELASHGTPASHGALVKVETAQAELLRRVGLNEVAVDDMRKEIKRDRERMASRVWWVVAAAVTAGLSLIGAATSIVALFVKR